MDFVSLDQPGTTVVTVNQRLSGWLRQQHEKAHLEAGDEVWDSPDILPFNSWLQRCWTERFDTNKPSSSTPHRLLSSIQSELIWEDVIRSSQDADLLNPVATARLVSKAWDIVNAWSIDLSSNVSAYSLDVQAFAQWQQRYLMRSQREQWLDQARLPSYLTDLFQQGDLAPPRRLILAGFDCLSVQQQDLFEALRQVGCEVEHWSPDVKQANVQCVGLVDAKSELMHVAAWARKLIEEDQNQRIGIVVPDLQQRRDEVERAFREVMYPAAAFSDQWPEDTPYNLSLGRPLIEYPIVDVAVSALRSLLGARPWQEIGHLLRSAFWVGPAGERSHRAQLDVVLRERGQLGFSLEQVLAQIQFLQQKQTDFCATTAQHLRDVLRVRDDWQPRQRTPEWAKCFSMVLSAFGWPGSRVLDSVEYQTLQAWLEALQIFSSLDGVSGVIAYDEALRLMTRLLRQTIFQPKSADAPIQIMGELESAGQQFDALWVTGLSQHAWPSPVRANPYVPVSLQRGAGIPEASASGRFEMALAQTQTWAQSADQVCFSWPLHQDGQVQAASALLQPWIHQPVDLEPSDQPGYECQIWSASRLRQREDELGPPLLRKQVKGGVAIIRDQSACPFRAFALHRLAANDLEDPQSGLDARARGSLVHQCLEAVWIRIHDQATLLGMSEENQHQLVSEVVANTLAHAAMREPELKGVLGEMEQSRLTKLLMDWLKLDVARKPFEVLDTEKRVEIELGGLQLNTTVDRIDRLADGSLAIIDYKTGECTHKDWFGDRPKDPQLPLYGSIALPEAKSLAFGRLKTGKLAYEGVASDRDHFSELKALADLKIDDVDPDWSGQQALWQQQLTELAEDFVAGKAGVDPLPDACRYCHLDTLCRVEDGHIDDEAESSQ